MEMILWILAGQQKRKSFGKRFVGFYKLNFRKAGG
jgi:hypothetical protein